MADIDAFLNSITFVGTYLDLLSQNVPSLYALSELSLGVKVCASDDPSAGCGVLLRLGGAEQLQWAVINLITN